MFSALSVHLIPLLQQMGHAVGTVVVFAALIGPMQVAGRLGEMALCRHASTQSVGMVTFAVLPIALLALALAGAQNWAALGFCLLYGLSNGIITIVRGTLPQALFGPAHYGAISGAMAGPSLVFKAAGPVALAWLANSTTSPSLILGALLMMSLLSFGGYWIALRTRHARPAPVSA